MVLYNIKKYPTRRAGREMYRTVFVSMTDNHFPKLILTDGTAFTEYTYRCDEEFKQYLISQKIDILSTISKYGISQLYIIVDTFPPELYALLRITNYDIIQTFKAHLDQENLEEVVKDD